MSESLTQNSSEKPSTPTKESNPNPVFFPHGHFHSPFPSLDEIKAKESQIFDPSLKSLPGIDLNKRGQLKLLKALAKYYEDLPFSDNPTEGLRYHFDNDCYAYSDAIFLYSMIRHFRPKRIVEIGCGYSSAVMLDTNEHFFKNKINCTFVDPHPGRLKMLAKPRDHYYLNILAMPVQETSMRVFSRLRRGDILFVDSSHVTKAGGDVNHILFQILPALAKGVIIHFHDIIWPFEYLKKWIYQGIAWNEVYAVRAFLQYNRSFKILICNTFLEHFHKNWFKKNMPLCLRDTGGSLWIQKVKG